MDLEQIIQLTANNGLATFIVIWGVIRLDKFLAFLCNKLEIYNSEFSEINQSIKELTEEIRKKSNTLR